MKKKKIILMICIMIFGVIVTSCQIKTINGNDKQLFYQENENAEDLYENIEAITQPTAINSESVIDNNCWLIKKIKQNNNLAGSVLIRVLPSEDYVIWKINSSTFTPISNLPDGYKLPLKINISPDGKQVVAFLGNEELQNTEEKLFVFSEGVVNLFDIPNQAYGEIQFLTNNRLLLPINPMELFLKGNYQKDIGFTDEHYILNLITGEITEEIVFLPKLMIKPHNVFPFRYNSTYEYVVYHASSGNKDEINSGEIKIMNISTQKNIVDSIELDNEWRIDPDIVPEWVPNKEIVTLIYWKNWERENSYVFSISTEGELSKIIDFEDVAISPVGYSNVLNWSNDGRYMLFDMRNKNDLYSQPFLWDNDSGIAYHLCFPEDDYKPTYGFKFSYFNSYLIGTTAYQKYEGQFSEGTSYSLETNSYIIDIVDKVYYEIPKDYLQMIVRDRFGGENYQIIGFVTFD